MFEEEVYFMIKILLITLCVFVILVLFSDDACGASREANVEIEMSEQRAEWDPYTFKFKQVVLPLTLMAAASTTLFVDDVRSMDNLCRRLYILLNHLNMMTGFNMRQ